MKIKYHTIPAFLLMFLCVYTGKGYPSDMRAYQKVADIERRMMATGEYSSALKDLGDVPGRGDDARISAAKGIAYYGMGRPAEAREMFAVSASKGRRDGKEGMSGYAVRFIDDNLRMLEDTAALEEKFENAEGEEKETLREELTARHFTFLKSMLGEKFYYSSLVVPHILWLKENAVDVEGLRRLSADIYYSAMVYSAAAEDLKHIVEDDPGDPVMRVRLADCLVACGDFRGADEHYAAAVDIYGNSGTAEAEREAARIGRIRRALPKSYSDISEMISKGHYKKAEALCRRRISVNPGDYAAITQLGQIYWRQNRRRNAIKMFRRAVKLAPDYPTARFFLGKAYFFERKPGKAMAQLDLFKQKMELMPDMDEGTVDFYVAAMHYISYMCSTMKMYERSMDENKRILELRPDDQRAMYNLAICYYMHEKNRSRAYNELKRIISMDPSGPMAGAAKQFIEYMRHNPDSRVVNDIKFVYQE